MVDIVRMWSVQEETGLSLSCLRLADTASGMKTGFIRRCAWAPFSTWTLVNRSSPHLHTCGVMLCFQLVSGLLLKCWKEKVEKGTVKCFTLAFAQGDCRCEASRISPCTAADDLEPSFWLILYTSRP